MTTSTAPTNTANFYQGMLRDHHRHPRNYGDVHDAAVIRRNSNPLCGDEVEVGLYYEAGTLRLVRFRGRACSVCIASASLMTEAVTGKNRSDAHRMVEEMQRWFGSKDGAEAPDSLASLHALSVVRDHAARRQCVLLAWEALGDALSLTTQ